MHVYVYTHTYIHTYMHTYIHMHTYACRRAFLLQLKGITNAGLRPEFQCLPILVLFLDSFGPWLRVEDKFLTGFL